MRVSRWCCILAAGLLVGCTEAEPPKESDDEIINVEDVLNNGMNGDDPGMMDVVSPGDDDDPMMTDPMMTEGSCGDGFCDTSGERGDAETHETCSDDCDAPAPPACEYPSQNLGVAMGQSLPKLNWVNAHNGMGQPINFSTESVFCDDEYSEIRSILFVISTGWCTYCPDMIKAVGQMIPQLKQDGMLVVFVEAQDAAGQSANNAQAQQYIDGYIGSNGGIRVGDGETQPTPLVFLNSPLVTAFPSAFAVRTSDMKVIVNWGDWDLGQFGNIAKNPEGDWSSLAGPSGPAEPPPVTCGEAEEEAYEANGNDDAAQAPIIGAGVVEGGICTSPVDFYRIEEPGQYQVDLAFTHSVGDLDMAGWDEAGNKLNESVLSETEDDNESITFTAPMTFMIYGFAGHTSVYTMTVTKL